MAYQKQTWRNLPDRTTPITAERLEHLETQYDEAASLISQKTEGLAERVWVSEQIENIEFGLTPVFNVFEYGAVGDGVQDDQSAVQQALDEAYNSGGGEVLLPGGYVFLIGSQIIIRENTTLSMYGAELLKPEGANFPWIRNFKSGEDAFPGYSGNSNILVRGGIINGQSHTAPDPSGNCLCFEHAENIEVRDVTFLNASAGQTHALEYNAVKNGRIINCNFLGYKSHGKIAEAIQLDIAVPGSGNLPPSDETPCRDILVEGCSADASDENGYWGALVGSHMARPGVKYENIKIVNCTVKGSLQNGIRMHQWEESIITGNTILNSPGSGILCEVGEGGNATETNRNNISYNIVRNCGTGVSVAGTEDAYFREVIIVGNIVRDSEVDGINVLRAQQAVIGNNTVTGSGEDGIQVHNSNFNVISNNSVRVAGRYGVLGSPALVDSKVEGNFVSGSIGSSMRFSVGSHRNLISGNIIRRDGQAANVYGISISNDSNDIQVYGNDMFGTGGLEGTGTRVITSPTNRA